MIKHSHLFSVPIFMILVVFMSGTSLPVSSYANEPPAVVKALAPTHYPPVARAAKIEGKVVVEATINGNGEVISAKAVEGPEPLRKTSEATALRWKFAASSEAPNVRTARLTFSFLLGYGEVDFIPFIPPYEVEFIGRVSRIS